VTVLARITREDVERLADTARLYILEDEIEQMTEELNKIIEYARTLQEVDTTGVEPTTHVIELTNVMRDDTPEEGIDRDLLFKNAPDHEDGQFKVPSVLD